MTFGLQTDQETHKAKSVTLLNAHTQSNIITLIFRARDSIEKDRESEREIRNALTHKHTRTRIHTFTG